MTPFWQDDHLTLYGGDCREVLRELPAESVHCVVTSPPYWGLRDYGTASWSGGDAECDHAPRPHSEGCLGCGVPMNDTTPGCRHCEDRLLKRSLRGTPEHDYQTPDPARSELPNPPAGWAERDATVKPGKGCRRCGATRIDSQLGLEATPEAFVANMVDVFREVRRVLRRDGTLWLNLGDSYASGEVGRVDAPQKAPGLHETQKPRAERRIKQRTGLKPKDLVGIPWRVAFALQADGWYLRSDIIWSKPNPMPESVTDRPTKAHEYLFLLTRSPRYYYDAEAVREAAEYGRRDQPASTWDRLGTASKDAVRVNGATSGGDPSAGRNLRSVWNIATEPYPGAHFATFPRKLVEPCVKAGTSERGVCPECGAPWVRVVEVGDLYVNGHTAANPPKYATVNEQDFGSSAFNSGMAPGMAREKITTGWRPSCTHEGEPVPAVVLDPFAGSGTTLLVAQSLGRRGVGIDLSPDYLRQALERNRQTPLGLVG